MTPASSSRAAAPAPALAFRPFAALTIHELYAILRLRVDVFVVEQACAYPEIDGRDPAAEHLLARAGPSSAGPGHALVGTLRLFGPGDDADDADGVARIGRVAVAASARGTGLGRTMMAAALDRIAGRHGDVAVALSAQAHLEAFYGALGFVRAGPDHRVDGIAHLDMIRTPR